MPDLGVNIPWQHIEVLFQCLRECRTCMRTRCKCDGLAFMLDMLFGHCIGGSLGDRTALIEPPLSAPTFPRAMRPTEGVCLSDFSAFFQLMVKHVSVLGVPLMAHIFEQYFVGVCQVYRCNFWMLFFKSKSPKRSSLWSNSKHVAKFWMGKLTKRIREQHKKENPNFKTTVQYVKDGRKRYHGSKQLRSTQKLGVL